MKHEKQKPLRRKYSREEYYWGKKPSAICDRVIEIIHPTPESHPKLIDLGCGEGRNAVYFAKKGFNVTGLDISKVGLEKTKRFAEEEGVNITIIHADIGTIELTEKYDVIFSTGTLQYLPLKRRTSCFQNYKNQTASNGINVHSVFVAKPFIARAPDFDKEARLYRSGELMRHYWDWEILYCAEETFECMSSGIPHKHAVNRIIARKCKK